MTGESELKFFWPLDSGFPGPRPAHPADGGGGGSAGSGTRPSACLPFSGVEPVGACRRCHSRRTPDWLTRDQTIDGNGKGICPPTCSSYGGTIDYSGAGQPIRGLFGPSTWTSLSCRPTGGLGSLQEESKSIRLWPPQLCHRGSGAQQSQARSLPAGLSWTSLLASPRLVSYPVGRAKAGPAEPTVPLGWDPDVHTACLSGARGGGPPAKSPAGEEVEPMGFSGLSAAPTRRPARSAKGGNAAWISPG